MVDPARDTPAGPPPAADAPVQRVGVDWRRLHLWQIQPIRDALVLMAIFGVVWLGYRLSLVTVPMLLAMLLAYLFEPLVKRVTRGGSISRPGAALGIIVLAGALVVVPLVVGLTFGVVQAAAVAQQQATNVQTLVRSVEDPSRDELREALPSMGWRKARDWLVDQRAALRQRGTPAGPPGGTAPDLPIPPADPGAAPHPEASSETQAEGGMPAEVQMHPEASPLALAAVKFVDFLRQNAPTLAQRAVQAGAGVFNWLISFAGTLGAVMFGGLLTAFFFYFFCTGWGKVLGFWEGLIPERRRGRVVDLVHQMDRVIASFVRGRLTICALQIVYFTAAFSLIGVPAPLIVGPLVGLITLVPYAAGILGVPVAILLMALDPPSGFRGAWWWIVLAPLAVQAVSQVLDDYVLTPRIQGKATDMSVPMILFASIAGGVLAGFYGLLLAIPVAACVKILLKEVFWPRFRAWAEGRERDFLPIQR
jgi:predicted PurR-regulated permease PerM